MTKQQILLKLNQEILRDIRTKLAILKLKKTVSRVKEKLA